MTDQESEKDWGNVRYRPVSRRHAVGNEAGSPAAGRLIGAIAIASAALCGACTPTAAPEEARPQQAGQPLDSARMAGQILTARAAALRGDQEAVQAQMEAMQEDYRRALKLPDASRRIKPEAARAVARAVDGVTSANWIDRENLLVMVDGAQHRTHRTIDRICLSMEPLGDTLAVVVNLQNRVARNGDELEILSRNCQLAHGDRAFLQRNRQVDVVPPEIRAQHEATKRRMADETRQREDEAAESMRILEATTPEM